MSKNPLASSRNDSVTSGQSGQFGQFGQDASGTLEITETTSVTKPGFAGLAAARPHSLLGQAEMEESSITSNPIQT